MTFKKFIYGHFVILAVSMIVKIAGAAGQVAYIDGNGNPSNMGVAQLSTGPSGTFETRRMAVTNNGNQTVTFGVFKTSGCFLANSTHTSIVNYIAPDGWYTSRGVNGSSYSYQAYIGTDTANSTSISTYNFNPHVWELARSSEPVLLKRLICGAGLNVPVRIYDSQGSTGTANGAVEVYNGFVSTGTVIDFDYWLSSGLTVHQAASADGQNGKVTYSWDPTKQR